MEELYHHGVKGMKWGVRKAARHEASARYLRKSADKLDKKSAESARAGNTYKSATQKGKALQKRALADRHAKIAKNLRAKANKPVSEFEEYKRSQRTKSAVKGVLGTVGTLAVGAAAAAVPIYIGKEFIDAILGAGD